MATAAQLARHVSTRVTPQSRPIPGRPEMVRNSAGGFGFQVDCWMQLRRFLILGTDNGTYYQSEQALTQENLAAATACADQDGARAVQLLLEIDTGGLAPKKNPALLVAAYYAAHPHTKPHLLPQLGQILRTGRDLLAFLPAVKAFRGRGRSLHRALEAWFHSKSSRDLAYQGTKYQQRDGFAMRDALRLLRPKLSEESSEVARYLVGKPMDCPAWQEFVATLVENSHFQELPPPDGVPLTGVGLTAVVEAAKRLGNKPAAIARLIRRYGLVREQVPTEVLKSPEVWEALLERMPMTAMVRNLGAMTACGLLKPLSNAAQLIVARLTDSTLLHKARIHPFQVLLALSVYQAGRGVKSSLSWSPVTTVSAALDDAFYASFQNVPPTHLRYLVGVDVSSSMGSAPIANSHLTARQAAAAMALLTARTEPQHQLMAFSHELVNLPVTARSSLHDAVAATSRLPFGNTDCALPMLYALQNQIPVDVFQVLTDNETWYGQIHPCQALQQYREKMGIPAKLVTCAFTAAGHTIADPRDSGMLDAVGLDASLPVVLRNFALGWQAEDKSCGDEDPSGDE